LTNLQDDEIHPEAASARGFTHRFAFDVGYLACSTDTTKGVGLLWAFLYGI
jgi:hypothetical protein